MRVSLKRVLVFSIAILFAACHGEPTTAPRLEHPVGEALEGIYYVGWRSLEQTYAIGTLKLQDGLYAFTPLIPVEQIPQAAIDRLVFVKNSEGQYGLKYQHPINENTLLEELNDFTFVVLIQFSAPAMASGRTRDSNDMFLVASDHRRKSLVFHSLFSELQLWGVDKAWD